MTPTEYLKAESIKIFQTYRPLYTEASGIKDVAIGIAGIAYSATLRLNISKDAALPSLRVSGVVMIQGLIKLTVPIILSSGYLLSKYRL